MLVTRKVLFFFFILLCSPGWLWSERLRFRYTPDQMYRLVTEVNENVYINGELSHRAEILNKIAVETLDLRDGSGLLSCSFQTSERAYGVRSSFSLTEDYQSLFWRDALGRYEIGPEYFMPVVRDVPLFPEGEIEPGATWSAPGEEVHDLRRSYGIDRAVHFPIQVSYTYLGRELREGRQLDVISIQYTVFYRLEGLSSRKGPVPVKITGISEQTYYWDNQRGQPQSYQERFDFIFFLSSGETVEYEGSARGLLIESQKLDKEKAAEEIRQELERRGVEDTTVRAEQLGVTLSLQNIQFQPNSAMLLPTEKEKLRQIGEILKSYSERDLLISGHTARVSGYTEEQHQLLSEQRAQAVADYLLSIGAIDETQSTTRGFGYLRPLADNATEEGRSLNRRVEITILEN